MKKYIYFSVIIALLLGGCSAVLTQTYPMLESQPQRTSDPESESSDTQVTTVDSQDRKLSEFTDEELLTFIIDNGIEIPYDFKDETKCAEFIRYVVEIVEDDPDFRFGFSYIVTVNFSEEIRNAAIDYYGLEPAISYHNDFSTKRKGENHEIFNFITCFLFSYYHDYHTRSS